MEKLVNETKEMFKEAIHIGKNTLLSAKDSMNCLYSADCNNKKLEIRNFHIFDKDSNSITSSFMHFHNYKEDDIHPSSICKDLNLIFENNNGLVIQEYLDFTENKIFFMKNEDFSCESNCYDCYISAELISLKFYKSIHIEEDFGDDFYINIYEIIGDFKNLSRIPIYLEKSYTKKSYSYKLQEIYNKILENLKDLKDLQNKIRIDFTSSNLVLLNETLTKTFFEYLDAIEGKNEKWDSSMEYIPQDGDSIEVLFL